MVKYTCMMPSDEITDNSNHFDFIDLELGKKLKAYRRREDKTQAEVAHHLDISPQQYQKYEKGASKCNISNIYKLAQYYNINVGELLPGSGPESSKGFQEEAKDFSDSPTPKDVADEAEAMAQLLAIFVRIPSKPTRRKILNLLNEML